MRRVLLLFIEFSRPRFPIQNKNKQIITRYAWGCKLKTLFSFKILSSTIVFRTFMCFSESLPLESIFTLETHRKLDYVYFNKNIRPLLYSTSIGLGSCLGYAWGLLRPWTDYKFFILNSYDIMNFESKLLIIENI